MRKFILITLAFVLLCVPLFAYAATTCPEGMSDADCLAYLQNQAGKLRNEKSSISGKISQEQYNQLSLLEKINYLDSQIAASENQIKQLELDIETKNVEIRLLAKDIADLQNSIDAISQEVTRLENAIEKRISLTYRYSYITPLEIFLESNNFDSLLRKFKYLTESRKKDIVLLSDLEGKKYQLTQEETVLSAKKSSVEKKRTEIENTKTDLYEEKRALSLQRGEKSNLLAISRQNEASYAAKLASIKKEEAKIAAQISNIIFNLYKSGQLPTNTPVKKGDVIGFQGHTGLAYGSHLHFELRINGVIVNPYSKGYFNWPNGNGSGRFPEDNAIITQFPHTWPYRTYAIDMVSGNDYLFRRGDKYYTKGITCYSYTLPAGYYNLNGEGAPIYAMKDGKVSRVFTDACGGKAVIVDYGSGVTALYLHLR